MQAYLYTPSASDRAYILGPEGETIKYWPKRGRFFEHTLRKFLEDHENIKITERFGSDGGFTDEK